MREIKCFLIGLAVMVFWFLLTYLLMAYGNLEYNPSKWSESARACHAILGGGVGMVLGICAGFNKYLDL